jgi:uncharacterized protein YegL
MSEFGEPRRLPVYLVLDCSASMAGVKIVGVNNGMRSLYQELMNDPRSLETVHVSVITFSDQAYQMPLVPIDQFTPPALVAQGRGALGAALHLLVESLEHDVRGNQPGKKGDYRPLVFILTDGMPTDHWETAAQRLAQKVRQKLVTVVVLAIGPDVDLDVMHRITDKVVRMDTVNPSSITAFFEWVSAGVAPSSDFQLHRTNSMSSSLQARPRVFVSHSHADDAFTKRLVDDLRAAGAEVWVDDTAIRDGNFAKHISDGLDKSDYLVLVLTPHAISSDWVQDEVFTAITLVKQHRMRAVIPLLAAACDLKSIPSAWASLHRYDAMRDYQAALAGLLRALGLPGSSGGFRVEL